MIVWGGYDAAGDDIDTGGIYDPASDTWQPTSTVGAPAARSQHWAVWTGSRMIVFGGLVAEDDLGRIYDPATDSWTPMTKTGAPPKYHPVAAGWDGCRIVMWGDTDDGTTITNEAWAYEPPP